MARISYTEWRSRVDMLLSLVSDSASRDCKFRALDWQDMYDAGKNPADAADIAIIAMKRADIVARAKALKAQNVLREA
jgi:hypothetical protein